MARPELLDRRPAWAGGKLNATTVLLEPLDAAETDALLDSLGGVDDELRGRIRDAAEGNPLFVEEMLALVHGSGGAMVEVPPTIQALLAARLDQLDPAERSVLERGSVEGRVFHQGAVRALSNGDTNVPQRLLALVRKELVRPDRAQFPGDDAYRFRHLLIRDAAYDALPKATRAELHQRFAEWLEQRAPDLVELDEILGHHLEQAVLYRRELGQGDAALAERAGRHLGRAGVRAIWRSDLAGATVLLERALDLLRPLGSHANLELMLATAYLRRSHPASAAVVADAAAERAASFGDRRGEAVLRAYAAYARALVVVEPDFDRVEELARAALPFLEEANDADALLHVWLVIADVENFRGRTGLRTEAVERALRYARRSGGLPTHLFGLGAVLAAGPRPADEALEVIDDLAPAPAPEVQMQRARLLAMLDRGDEASALATANADRLRELTGEAGAGELALAEIAELRGDDETAERLLRRRCAEFEKRQQWPYLSTYAPLLGHVLCRLGRYDEAEPLADRGRELGTEEDVATQQIWRQVKALVLARRSEHEEAVRLAREAVEIAERTDLPNAQGRAWRDLGEVLELAGRTGDAIAALEQALERYERKKNLAMTNRTRGRLALLLQLEK